MQSHSPHTTVLLKRLTMCLPYNIFCQTTFWVCSFYAYSETAPLLLLLWLAVKNRSTVQRSNNCEYFPQNVSAYNLRYTSAILPNWIQGQIKIHTAAPSLITWHFDALAIWKKSRQHLWSTCTGVANRNRSRFSRDRPGRRQQWLSMAANIMKYTITAMVGTPHSSEMRNARRHL